ncbi:MAG TPA: uroporphyrinogen decarboxylase family protein [Clostridia bacterium]|nr:uroporphyrinogen decarboxylase family protein [Clostridia bacterium]
MLTHRENYLATVRFQNPAWIPMQIHISDASWDQYREEMEAVALRNPDFFPQVRRGWRDYERHVFAPAHRRDEPFVDNWGCTWETPRNGLEGVVTRFPLDRWEALSGWRTPDLETQADRGPRDWEGLRQHVEQTRAEGGLVHLGLPHGFLFLRLTYLRGFENALCDLMEEDPRFVRLFDDLVEYNLQLVRRFLALGPDVMGFPEDLGTQTGPIISPSLFEKWFVPAYAKLMKPCRDAGVLTHFHSDGKTLDILEQQIRAGVQIVNPQDLANGIDALAERIKGRACIDLDIDRQRIVPYGTRQEIHDLIEEEVKKLGSPRGGLTMIAGIYPPTPPENVDALCAALRKYRTYWWD